MVGWHHRLNGHEFEQTLGDSEGQGRLACCNLWGRKKLYTPERQQQQQQIGPGLHSLVFTRILPD